MIIRPVYKHTIDHIDVEVEVDMAVQAGAKPVDVSHRANLQGGLVNIRCTRAVGR